MSELYESLQPYFTDITTDNEEEGQSIVKQKPQKAPKDDVKDHKPDLSLLPMDVLGTELLKAYEEGVIKYARDSWRMGFDFSQMVAGARRHIDAFWEFGEDLDPDAVRISGIDKHHLAGAIFCLVSLIYMQMEGLDEHFDDRRKKTQEEDLVFKKV